MDNLAIFNEQRIRRHWDEKQEKWYFSVVDVVGILSESKDPKTYRKVLKTRLKTEGNETVTNCNQLKMLAQDGKMRKTDVADVETILRLIQSIPSPNAEPFKQRLASLGNERIDETNDPELGIARARARAIAIYKNKGMTKDEIQRRISSIETRNDLTDEYQARGIVGGEYGILTNLGYGIFGTTAEGIKQKKGLGKHDNPRDHMNKTELLLTELTEETSKNLIKKHDAKGFNQIEPCVIESVGIIQETKNSIEKATGENVLTNFNRLSDRQKLLRDRENNNKLPKKDG